MSSITIAGPGHLDHQSLSALFAQQCITGLQASSTTLYCKPSWLVLGVRSLQLGAMLMGSVTFQFYRMISDGVIHSRISCKIEDWGLESTWSTLQFYQLKPCNLPTCSLPNPIVKDIMLTFIHHPATCANIFTCFYYRKSKLFLQLHCWDGRLNPALAYCLRIVTKEDLFTLWP